jgi:hypothetical protein
MFPLTSFCFLFCPDIPSVHVLPQSYGSIGFNSLGTFDSTRDNEARDMLRRAPHPCNQPGCSHLTNTRFCEDHAHAQKLRWRAEQEAKRPSARVPGH